MVPQRSVGRSAKQSGLCEPLAAANVEISARWPKAAGLFRIETPMKVHLPDSVESEHSTLEWIVSLMFWGQLLLATTLYTAVALSPKLHTFLKLQSEHSRTQSQLVSLENHIEELDKVVEVLQKDPRVVEELARLDLDASKPGEKRIPLEGGVNLQSRLGEVVHAPDVARAWYEPLVQMFAERTSLRITALVVAGVLVVISFTFFHPAQARQFHLRLEEPESRRFSLCEALSWSRVRRPTASGCPPPPPQKKKKAASIETALMFVSSSVIQSPSREA